MTVSLLDTNIILDDYYEKRENHELIEKFIRLFKYGELNYTTTILTECIEVLTKAFSQFSAVLNNALSERRKQSIPWDNLKLEKKREFIASVEQQIESNPDRFGRNAPFLLQLFEVLSANIEILTENELREIVTLTIPSIILPLTSYLKGRFNRVDPYFPTTAKEYEDKTKNIQPVLSSVFVKPYDSNDMKITFDILMLIIWGSDQNTKIEDLTFYSNDISFLDKLNNLKVNHMNKKNPNYICDEDKLKYFNPYSEEYGRLRSSQTPVLP